ncbi:hypothetical protein RMSM_02903 [Rhodopirellula maiorica SM1]|uniref:Uncharacterized protein n=1 Tax=Rhodopirellula maiorica SM1 TaxID=1265738 RepID=M5RLG6_9BACT|nr:hypothetical protein [Rhodopirellula maiorica]EMI20173.1 hypothetical protein RMSM_02903 [Rhodopirellula maiorica SM1]
MFGKWVEIEFDCLPLRTVARIDAPLDASPVYEQFVLRVKDALQRHGAHNTYYLHRGVCRYHLTNDPLVGMLEFSFEGTVMTGEKDVKTKALEISVELKRETCEWLTEPMVTSFAESVQQALMVEFDRYIEAGDLKKTEERIKAIQEQNESDGGFIGMYL